MNKGIQLLGALFLASTFTFTSCGDDDEGQIVIDGDNLVGTWTMSSAEASDPLISVLLQAFSPQTYVFNSDNTYTSVIEEFGEGEGTWAFASNSLTLDPDTESEETYEIRELSNSRLIMYIEGEEDGEVISVTLTYSK